MLCTVVRIAVRVQPRARKDEIAGERDGALIVRVTVVRGASGRDKLVEIDGMDTEAVRRALSLDAA